MAGTEMREHPRDLINADVTVNDGSPYKGGTLYDWSQSGVAVMYPHETAPSGDPIEVGQVLTLKFGGQMELPARVARTFDGGFATKFDFSIRVEQ